MLEGGVGRVVTARLPMEGARESTNLIKRVLEEGGPEAVLECPGLKSVLMLGNSRMVGGKWDRTWDGGSYRCQPMFTRSQGSILMFTLYLIVE